MEGYKITKVIDGGKSQDGDFVAVVQMTDGEPKGLALAWEQVDELSCLLLAAISRKNGRELFFEIPKSLHGRHPVAKVEVSTLDNPAWPGTFLLKLSDDDGASLTLTMPHEVAVQWRDNLSAQINEFVKTMAKLASSQQPAGNERRVAHLILECPNINCCPS